MEYSRSSITTQGSDMVEQFSDRILRCSDCQREFIFTAGEQLFFLEKQFKNDPRRCKPCKSRRTGLAAVASGAGPAAAGLSRTETRTECSDCGVDTTVPFRPTQGRPVLCRQCFQAKNRAAAEAQQPAVPPQVVIDQLRIPLGESDLSLAGADGESTAKTISALTLASTDLHDGAISADEALMAASSMASASALSSVASAADLASIVSVKDGKQSGVLPAQLLTGARVEGCDTELLRASVEAGEA